MCGDHFNESRRMTGFVGSSPHVRGPPHLLHHRGDPAGIIPACAGTTFGLATDPASFGDHPRMCGDHGRERRYRQNCGGSSPHVRGPHEAREPQRDGAGIIPACAGTTCAARARRISGRDHPRMCGDHFGRTLSMNARTGSSPHVRGPPLTDAILQLVAGIIPACAGTTRTRRTASRRSWDHPRMCGDHSSPPAI